MELDTFFEKFLPKEMKSDGEQNEKYFSIALEEFANRLCSMQRRICAIQCPHATIEQHLKIHEAQQPELKYL